MKTTEQDPNRISKSALARLLDASRTTISRHLLSGDAPRARRGLYDKGEALRFLRTRISKTGASPELERLRIRKLELEISKIEHELAVSKKEYIKLSTVWPQIAKMIPTLSADLYGKFESELPNRYAGKGVVEISLLNRDTLDEAFAKFRTAGAAIAPPAAQ